MSREKGPVYKSAPRVATENERSCGVFLVEDVCLESASEYVVRGKVPTANLEIVASLYLLRSQKSCLPKKFLLPRH